MIFLDTDIISYYHSSDEKVIKKVVELIDNDSIICTTIINVYEVIKGLRWKNNKREEERFYLFLNEIKVLSINDKEINLAANIYADLRKKGKTIGDSDIIIAAIVISNKGTLITNNLKHFEHIKQLKSINCA